jgi:hypothetical protein
MKRLIAYILLVILTATYFIPSNIAYQQQGKISSAANFSSSVNILNLKFDFALKLQYELNYSINYSDQTPRGESNNLIISLIGGHLNLIFNSSLIKQPIEINQTLKLGEQLNFPIGQIINIAIVLKAEAPVSVKGDASSEASTITFDNEGQQSIKINVKDNARVGDTVEINLPFSLRVLWAITSPITLQFAELGKTEMTPVIKAQFKVAPTWLDMYFLPLIIGLIIVIGAVITIVILFRKRKRIKT